MSARKVAYNHDVRPAYPGALDGITGVEYYGARVLASTNPGDLVHMPEALLCHAEAVLKHYERVGLPTASRFLGGDGFEALGTCPEFDSSFFFFGREAHAVRPNADFFSIATKMNSKNQFIQFCQEAGIPVPTTQLFPSSQQVSTASVTYPVYLKADCSASGQGVFRCESSLELSEALSQIQGPLQIQEALPKGVDFFNIQYDVRDGTLRHGALTLQILEGTAHAGNQYPSGVCVDLVQPVTDNIARHFYDEGMRGVWGIDVAVRGEQVWVIEANPRWNGSTYCSIPAEKLGVTEWASWNVRVDPGKLSSMNLGDLEFNPKTRTGIVLINWGIVESGKLGLLLAGPPSIRGGLMAAFARGFCS